MAINTFVNCTSDKNAANKADRRDHVHTSAAAAASAGDLSVSWDSAVVTKLSVWDSLIDEARKQAISRGLR